MKCIVCRESKITDCLRRSWEPCLHDQVRRRTAVACEKDVVDSRTCRHRTGKGSRCVIVWISAAVDMHILFGWTCAAVYGLVYFSLNFGRSLSTAWYILIWILFAASTVWFILVRMGNDNVKSWLLKIVAIYRKLKNKKVKIFGEAGFQRAT